MMRDEFIGLLKRFADRPLPATTGRHVYVWQGTLEQLTAAAPRRLITVLDLHALCQSLDRTPNTLEAARKTMVESIGKWLERELPRDNRQRALAVIGCDLLMRYSVPLGQFAQLASETQLIVWVVPADDSRYRPAKPLPAYVHFQPESTLAYFKSQMADDALIGE